MSSFLYRDALSVAKELSITSNFWRKYYNHLVDMNERKQASFENLMDDAGIEDEDDFVRWVEA